MGVTPEQHRRLFKASIGAILALGSLGIKSDVHEQHASEQVTTQALSGRTMTYDLPDQYALSLAEQTTIPATTTTVPPSPQPRPKPKPVSYPAPAAPPLDEQKVAWLQAAGIAESDYNYVDEVFTPESHWNPSDVSPKGCIGLGQNCPASDGSYWLEDACPNWQEDPVCQIQRFDGYAIGKYV